jgi:CIC family chloride channel protein
MRERLTATVEGLRRRLRRRRAIEPVMLVLAALTGFATGVLAWLLIRLIELVQGLVWSTPVATWQLVVVPTLGGLAVGLLLARVVPEASGGGVVMTMETLTLRAGRFRSRVPFGGTVATGVSLGTGASGGREGPIVLIGGSLGSLFARMVPLDEDRTRALVAAGAAAGIGASFNAPIGGMLFAIELLLGGLRRAGSLQVVVIASVVGSVTARQLVGEGLPLFRPAPGLELGAPSELLLYAALGLTAVMVASGFRRGDELVRRWSAQLRRRVGMPLTVAAGGLGVGLIALLVPEVLSDGAELPPIDGDPTPIQTILDVGYGTEWSAALLLLGLLVAKLVATCLSMGSGAAVGVFAPTLFTGAALGGAFGIAASQLLGTDVGQVGAFALVGMAAVFAATARAPLTAVLIVFELTGSYDLVLPLMLSVGVATFVAELRGSDSIYLHQLRQRGVVYGQTEDLDVLQTVTVGEVMTPEHPVVPDHLGVEELRARFHAGGTHGYAVADAAGRLVGVVTLRDLERDGSTAGELCTRPALSVTPEDPVFRAVRRMASRDVGRLPVVDATTGRVVGMLRRADVVRAYQRGISRSLGAQQRDAAGRLRDLAGVRFVEVLVDEDSPLAGAAVRDISWPERSVLTSVRRDGEVVVPTGGTVLAAGDELVVLTARGDDVRALVRGADR